MKKIIFLFVLTAIFGCRVAFSVNEKDYEPLEELVVGEEDNNPDVTTEEEVAERIARILERLRRIRRRELREGLRQRFLQGVRREVFSYGPHLPPVA